MAICSAWSRAACPRLGTGLDVPAADRRRSRQSRTLESSIVRTTIQPIEAISLAVRQTFTHSEPHVTPRPNLKCRFALLGRFVEVRPLRERPRPRSESVAP